MYTYFLNKADFTTEQKVLLQNDHFTAESFLYPSGIAALKISNAKGHMIILPFDGQIIWDVVFDGKSLTMDNMFSEPKRGNEIIDTYGCFAFHSGLLANGCPGPDDVHPLHGEFPTSAMDRSYLMFDETTMTIHSEFEYVKGFGHHYMAKPSVTMTAGTEEIGISLEVQNRSNYQKMPLQYMCHMNYAYVENGVMTENIPEDAFYLRTSVPGHVKPNDDWKAYMAKLEADKELISVLDRPEMYDPEICFFTKNLTDYTDTAEFEMSYNGDRKFFIRFDTEEFPYATRWLLNNADQKVAAFALPGTSTPEGYLAAERAGTVIELEPGEIRVFNVRTGIK